MSQAVSRAHASEQTTECVKAGQRASCGPARERQQPPCHEAQSAQSGGDRAALEGLTARLRQSSLRVAVVVATRGRPSMVAATVNHLKSQSLQPERVIISCSEAGDAPDFAGEPAVTVVFGPPGLSRQRNHALEVLPDNTDLVVFFDDDFVACRSWIEQVEHCFRSDPNIACVTGRVIKDGIKGPGLSFEDALKALSEWQAPAEPEIREPYSPYGCNMAFRRSAIRSMRFDERLPLYGWLEDRDFGGALARKGGRLIQLRSAAGVHLGVKNGRLPGLRLGYSQIANPLYLHRKGTMTFGSLVKHISKNMSINVARSMAPEPYIDRLGRLQGNLRAIGDYLVGTIAPERVETL